MKQEAWSLNCREDLIQNGFMNIKPHVFGRICEGILQLVSFEGQKTDIYVWKNSVPLALPDIQLGAGCPPASGRFPKKPREYSASSAPEIESVQRSIGKIVSETVIPDLDKHNNFQALERAFAKSKLPQFAFYYRGFCLLQSGQFSEGRAVLETLPEQPYPHDWKDKIDFFTSLPDAQIPEEIENSIQSNFKRLQIRKLQTAN